MTFQSGKGVSSTGGGNVMLFPYSRVSEVGTWVIVQDANQVFNGYRHNTSAAQNDSQTFTVDLRKGTYRFDLFCITTSNRGICHVLIDGMDKGQMDTYTSGQVNNAHVTLSSVALATDGSKTIELKVASKNGSSAGYRLSYMYCSIMRTGD